MKIALKQIKPKRISDQVFEQLRNLIYRGELRLDDKVLPERELSLAMGGSRTTVRNAIKKLVALGFLEQKQGQGTFVCHPEIKTRYPLAFAMSVRMKNATLEDLLEVRMGLECNAAVLAATRATEEDIQRMVNLLETIENNFYRNVNTIDTDVDVDFHMAIAFATQNPVYTYLMKKFQEFLFVGLRKNLRLLYKNPQNIMDVLDQHRKLVRAMQQHDPEMAFSTMRLHIRYVLLFFRDHGRKDLLSKTLMSRN